DGALIRSHYLNAKEGLSAWTPFHLAAIGGHIYVVYLLMEAGCDSRVQDRVGSHHDNTMQSVGLRARAVAK
ncbi:unnamed protein product, partial [Scytosiphon promiscuus]